MDDGTCSKGERTVGGRDGGDAETDTDLDKIAVGVGGPSSTLPPDGRDRPSCNLKFGKELVQQLTYKHCLFLVFSFSLVVPFSPTIP